MNKITEEELKSLKEVVSNVNKAKGDLAEIEINKRIVIDFIMDENSKLMKLQDVLKDKYGVVTVSLEDGSIKPKEDGAVS